VKKKWPTILLPILLFPLITWGFAAPGSQDNVIATKTDQIFQTTINPAAPPPSPSPDAEEANSLQPARPKPETVKGVYVTGWMAGSEKWFPRIVRFINETEVNTMVIDVKDDTGTLSYVSAVPLVNRINSFEKKIPDIHKTLATLRQNNIFPIARIVVFKDPFLAEKMPDWAVKDINGGLWKDRKGLYWVDPYNKQYWDYIVAISIEAVQMGFQEIQYDYVRFTSDGNISRCRYSFNDGNAPEEVIKEFLRYARAKLNPYQVPVSADIFGLVVSADGDLGIGQRFEKIAANVDIVCPMVYPSHYIPGNFGLKNPDLAPYETVYHSLTDAQKRLREAGLTTTGLRPWLQDFSLGSHYGEEQLQAQIRAVNDAGLKEWIFWNPSCRYDPDKYR